MPQIVWHVSFVNDNILCLVQEMLLHQYIDLF